MIPPGPIRSSAILNSIGRREWGSGKSYESTIITSAGSAGRACAKEELAKVVGSSKSASAWTSSTLVAPRSARAL